MESARTTKDATVIAAAPGDKEHNAAQFANPTHLPTWTNAWGDGPPAGLFSPRSYPSPPVQTKLAIGEPGDPYEQEADQVAERVIRMPDPAPAQLQLQRKCACGGEAGPDGECEQCRQKRLGLQRKATTDAGRDAASGGNTAPPIVDRVLLSPGQPLDAATRRFMEPRLGMDLGHVKVHTDKQAAKSARATDALAYTVGSNVVFGEGQYEPNSDAGKRLLAHELAHVAQQQHFLYPFRRLQRQFVTPLAPGGGFGGLMDRDRQRTQGPPSETGETADTAPVADVGVCEAPPEGSASKILNFYHGTAWSIAKTIPGNVKAIGGGDFAAGFYTHHDADDSKALARALAWAKLAAKKKKEKYAGIVVFKVPENYYNELRTCPGYKEFELTSTKQADYKERQKEWLDFVTSYGRKKQPVYRQDRGDWVHEPRDPQPKLSYNVIQGPFYGPVKGTPDKQPAPEEFKPYAEGTYIPHQYVFANEGVDLLNDSAKTTTELQQYDADTGKRIDPPVDVPAPPTPAPVPHVSPPQPPPPGSDTSGSGYTGGGGKSGGGGASSSW